jgi:hypothetical protein
MFHYHHLNQMYLKYHLNLMFYLHHLIHLLLMSQKYLKNQMYQKLENP